MVSTLEQRVLLVAPMIEPTFGNEAGEVSMSGHHGETLTYLEGQLVTGYDPDGTSVHLEVASNPQQGTVTFANSNVIYTPNDASYVGPDTFSIKYVDEDGEASTAVTVNVRLSNAAPMMYMIYSADPYVYVTGGYHDTAIVQDNSYFYLADNDSDPVTLSVVSNVSHGTLNFNAQTGAFTYTPNALYVGPDSFSFTGNDGFTNGASADTITVMLNVTNMTPELGFDTYMARGGEVIRIAISELLENDSDVDDPLNQSTFQYNTDNSMGMTVRRVGNELLIKPPMPTVGDPPQTYTFTYTLRDGPGAVGSGTVMIYSMAGTLKEMWLATIQRAESEHIGYIYYEALSLAQVYAQLYSAADQVEGYSFGSVTSAQYSPYWNTVTIPSGMTTLPESTVIHETVHAVDDFNGWYLGSAVININYQGAERLAWAGENLLLGNSSPLAKLRSFEDYALIPAGRTDAEIVDKWQQSVIKTWALMAEDTYTYPGNSNVPIGVAGWSDFWTKFGLGGLGSCAQRYMNVLSAFNWPSNVILSSSFSDPPPQQPRTYTVLPPIW